MRLADERVMSNLEDGWTQRSRFQPTSRFPADTDHGLWLQEPEFVFAERPT